MLNLDNLELGFSPLSESIFLGKVSKTNKNMWLDGKCDVTNMFIGVMLQKFKPGTKSEIKVDGVVKYVVKIEKVK